jgi:hypothetical protein
MAVQKGAKTDLNTCHAVPGRSLGNSLYTSAGGSSVVLHSEKNPLVESEHNGRSVIAARILTSSLPDSGSLHEIHRHVN